MTGRPECVITTSNGRNRRTGRRGRAIVVGYFGLIVVVVDALLYFLAIPWVDGQDWSKTHYGSVGFALFFVMVLFTFLSSVALAAFYFSSSSYPTDKWQ